MLYISLCVSCNWKVQEGIFSEDFMVTFLKVILPLIILVPLLIIYFRFRAHLRHHGIGGAEAVYKAPAVVYSLLIRIGMGGFLDAIILHQVLQWHQMLSNQIFPDSFITKSVNMFWDGIFEGVTWILSVVGILLMRHSRNSTAIDSSNSIFYGGLLAGWGVFNLMDSVNHFIFRFHNVRENVTNPEVLNWGFLILSVIMCLSGMLIIRKKG
jgi:uncharacterized membrane protein